MRKVIVIPAERSADAISAAAELINISDEQAQACALLAENLELTGEIETQLIRSIRQGLSEARKRVVELRKLSDSA